MRLTRVYVEAALRAGTPIELPAAAATHLAKVLRVRAGDELTLFAGDGREFACTVQTVRGSKVGVMVHAARSVDRESPLAVTLVQCVPRGDRMDLVVQKATELGVARIVPVLSRRSVVRLGPEQARSKLQHWRAVAAGACEQCGRNRLPAIDAPLPLDEYLGQSAPTAPDAAAPAVRLLLDPELESLDTRRPIAAAAEIAVGPEGGFAPEEIEAFRICGYAPLRLGPRILRTETAAIAALAWLQSRYGDMGAGGAALTA